MSKINIKFMTDEALDILRGSVDAVTEKLIENPKSSDWLKDFVDCDLYVTKNYQIEDFTLEIPKDDNDHETDYKNSMTLYEHLKDLPPYIKSDERFWLWINFEKGYCAALKHMPISESSSVFKDHWLFKQGQRRGLFFGVLSRLYYRVELSLDTSNKDDPFWLAKFVNENPNRFRGLSWRAYSNEKAIVLGALKAEYRFLKDFPEFKEATEKQYAVLAKTLSKRGSAMLLDVMSEKDIEDFVYEEYKSMVIKALAKKAPVGAAT